ncbi:hypothetical protein [Trinickia acidisoli]|uniref:hypothetical protein n=1 Tax=Trinickia acidisoli TaxID=2767482 RepID=UPI001A8FB366|nr:hypothetical protein [Trinickia acidisoli]
METRDTTFANASSEAIEAHGEAKKHSSMMTGYECPDCSRGKLFADVFDVNENGHRYEIDVRCIAACGAAQIFRV